MDSHRERLSVIVMVALGASMACSGAWAVNKCTAADGKVVFQDAPCTGRGESVNVKPASGHAPKGAAPAGTAQPTTKQGVPTEGVFGESWQRRTYLENRGIPDAYATINAEKQACDRKIANLRAQQGSANNNLAGAMYLQSLAAEMQATATMCDTRSRELNAQLESMKNELNALKAK